MGRKDRIGFANYITVDIKNNNGDQCLHCMMQQWRRKGSFEIFNDITKYVELVQLMNMFRNVNHVVSIVGAWIFGSDYNRVIQITKEELYLICWRIN